MSKAKYRSLEGWDKPRDGLFMILIDRWWIVDDSGNPIAFNRSSPQCNSNHDIALRIANGRPLKFLPLVYMPINPRDYC